MDAEKLTEVEMKELMQAEVQDDKDAEKGKMEGTKEAEKEAEEEEKKEKEIKEAANVYQELKNLTEDVYNPSMSTSSPKHNEETEKKAEEKEKKEKEKKEKEIKEEGNVYSKLKNPTEDVYSTAVSTSSPKRSEAEKVKEIEKEEEDEEAEDSLYCKLKTPSENVYMSAMSSSTLKQNKDVYRRVVLYKRISVVLTILSVLLLAVVIALAMKLHEGQSIQSCPERPETKQLNCTREICQTMYPSTQAVPGYQCSECGNGWVKYEKSCYFISKDRLNWQESREACQKKGGDLIVIDNERVQKFLTKNWGMLYWIGLRYSENQQWMWINNSALTQSYWANGQPKPDTQGSCALLRGQRAPIKNWHSNPCVVSSQYICQRG